jgi:hypothetical protein
MRCRGGVRGAVLSSRDDISVSLMLQSNSDSWRHNPAPVGSHAGSTMGGPLFWPRCVAGGLEYDEERTRCARLSAC